MDALRRLSELETPWMASIVMAALCSVSCLAHAAEPSSGSVEEIASRSIRNLASDFALHGDSALSGFWAQIETQGTPLLEEIPGDENHLLVTLLYRDAVAVSVRLQSNINALLIEGLLTEDFDRLGEMQRLAGTDVWYLSMVVPNDVRAPYIFQVTGSDGDGKPKVALDPLNPKRLWPESRFAWSVVETPEAEPQSWNEESSEVARGEWVEETVNSGSLGGEQEVHVYLPAGYDPARSDPYDVLVGLDVSTFRQAISTGLILDNLTAAGEIPATVAIVAGIGGKASESQIYLPTLKFIADELLPVLTEKYNLSTEATRVSVAGTSRRGLVASYLALSRPEVVGNVIALSASYYWRPPGYAEFEWLPRLFAERDKQPIRLYVSAGSLENVVNRGNHGHYMLSTNRHMRNVLTAKGYDFLYREFGGVHHVLSWREELAHGLIFLHGPNLSAGTEVMCRLEWNRDPRLYAGTCTESTGDEYGMSLESTGASAPFDGPTELLQALVDTGATGELTVPEEGLVLPVSYRTRVIAGQATPVIREPRGWFPISVEWAPGGLNFSYSLDVMVPATREDLAILERANEILAEPGRWNDADDRDCDDDVEEDRFSLYCALARAASEVTGSFDHRQPALQVIRLTIEELAPDEDFEHRLMDFNNSRSFDAVKTLLSTALQQLAKTLAQQGALASDQP